MGGSNYMLFEMKHRLFNTQPLIFTELDAPVWLTGEGTKRGSTMDCRWFWEEHVKKLEVGKSIETDFRIITRID